MQVYRNNFPKSDKANSTMIVVLLLWLVSTSVFSQETAQTPIQNVKSAVKQSTLEVYLPVRLSEFSSEIKQLSAELLKHGLSQVEFKTIDYWHNYQQGLRAGREGVYFAPPHFAAWAISEHQFLPLLRLAEPLSYVIAVNRNQPNFFEINDLADKAVCSTQPLNLDYLLINNALGDGYLSADIVVVNSVPVEMRKASSDCDGFSLSNFAFEKVDYRAPNRFIRLHKSKQYNNYVMVSHPATSAEKAAALIEFFALQKTQNLLKPILSQFASETNLIPSIASDYPSHYWRELAPYWQ